MIKVGEGICTPGIKFLVSDTSLPFYIFGDVFMRSFTVTYDKAEN